MIKLTEETVKKYWAYMTKKFKIRVKKKTGSWLMALIQPFTGISKKDWPRFSTMLGRTLYTDIVPGEQESSLLSQIILITHECQHRAQQYRRAFSFSLQYLFSPRFRMRIECGAYESEMEIYFKILGEAPPYSTFMDKLKFYLLRQKDLEKAAIILSNSRASVVQGFVTTSAGRHGLYWFALKGQVND